MMDGLPLQAAASGGGALAVCKGEPTFPSQRQFCGYAMPPYNAPQCMPGVLVPQMGVPPPPMYGVAPAVMLDPTALPCRPADLPSHTPMALPATPNPAHQRGQTLGPGMLLVPHQDFLLHSAPSGASATARNLCSIPASASPPNPATVPLTPKVEAASPPEVLTDGSGIGVSATAESKALSPGVQSVPRHGEVALDRLGSDSPDEDAPERVGGIPLRTKHGETLGWGSSGRDASDTSDDIVSYRMDPVLEAEMPRLCRKGNQQGPQSDRTGQHTALGLQGTPRTADVEGGDEGFYGLCFKPESNSTTGSDGVATSSGPSMGNRVCESGDRIVALLRATSNKSEPEARCTNDPAQPVRPRATRVVASSGGDSAWVTVLEHRERGERPPSAGHLPLAVFAGGTGQKRRDSSDVSGSGGTSKRPRSLSAPADATLLQHLRAAVSAGRPDAVRTVLGESLFQRIRGDIMRQQEQHHQQVLDLHRIVEEHRRLAAELSATPGAGKKHQPPSDDAAKVKREDMTLDPHDRPVGVPAKPAQSSAPCDALGPQGLAQQGLTPPLGFPPNMDPYMAALMGMPPNLMCAGSAAFPGPPGCLPHPQLVSGAPGMLPGMGPMMMPPWMPGAGFPAGPLGPSFPGMPPGWCPPVDCFMPPGFPDPAAMHAAAFPMPHGGLPPGMPMPMGSVNPAGFPRMPGVPSPNMQDAAAQANYGAWMERHNMKMAALQQHHMAAQQQQMAAMQAAAAAPGQSSSVTQDNDEGRGHAKRAARLAARPSGQDPSRRHKGQAPPASPTQ